jgi:hypothetical protein
MTEHKISVARDRYQSQEYTVAAIAKTLGVSRASTYCHLANAATDRSPQGLGPR